MADAQLVRNRYTFTREKFLGNSFSVPYLFLNPRLGLNYNIDDAWSSYVSFAYTSHEPELTNLYEGESAYYGATPQFKADTTGGVVRYDFSQPLVQPEQLFDGEFGIRAARPMRRALPPRTGWNSRTSSSRAARWTYSVSR